MSDKGFDWVNLESSLCTKIVETLNDETKYYFGYLEQINGILADSSKASNFINTNSWTKNSNFRVDLGLRIEDDLLKVEYSRYAIKDTSNEYYDQFVEGTMSTCGLVQRWQSSREDANSIDSNLSLIRETANSQPWYSKGYTKYSTDIYYKYSNVDDFECDYDGSTCGQISFQTRDGCSDFSASLIFLDSTDQVVYDTVIESKSNVSAGEKFKLKFHSFDSGAIDIADEIQLESASCS
jgi:hypothetical protein